MPRKSIAYRISIFISLAVIGVFIAFIFVYFLFSHRFIKENAMNKAKLKSSIVEKGIERYVLNTSEMVAYISDEVLNNGKQISAKYVVGDIVTRYSYINSIYLHLDTSLLGVRYCNYFAYREGDSSIMLTGNDEIHVARKEQHVQSLFKGDDYNKDGWSEPYICNKTNTNVVAYYYPLIVKNENNEDVLIGKIVCELLLDDITRFMSNLKVGKTGYAHLLSKKGLFIYHNKDSWSMSRTIFDLPPKVYGFNEKRFNKVLNYKKSGFVVVYPEVSNYKKSLVYYTRIEGNDWTLLLCYPYDELYSSLYLQMLQLLFFSVLGILAVYMLVAYITNREIEPLTNVSRELKKFAFLNQPHTAVRIPENEVVQIEESLDDMQSWYNKYLIDQSKEEKERKVQQENLEQAAEIQQGFIKKTFPAFPGRSDVDLYSIYKPKYIIGGDLFDYFFVDKENIVLTMGDVSGKGLPAAFFMSIAQTIIKNNEHYFDANEIVKNVNEELYTNNHHQFFLTLFLGIFNVKNGVLRYCNAAHTVSYILKSNGNLLELDQSHGLPLALYTNKEYNESLVRMKKGDTLILYTDGVLDLLDERQKRYGKKRFKKKLIALAGEEPKIIVERLVEDFEEYKGKLEQADDISLLVFKYNL